MMNDRCFCFPEVVLRLPGASGLRNVGPLCVHNSVNRLVCGARSLGGVWKEAPAHKFAVGPLEEI